MNYIFYQKETIIYYIEYINSICEIKPELFVLLPIKNNLLNVLECFNNGTNKFFFINIIPNEIFNHNIFSNESFVSNCYLINMEQISRKEIKDLLIMYGKKIKIIDYSYSNIFFGKKFFTKIKIKNNIFYLPYQINFKEIKNFDKIFDIVIIGKVSPRRQFVFDQISKFFKIDWLVGFGDLRDEKLFKYKILINIHYNQNYNIFEQIRCNRCIYNKMIIISENSILDKKFCLQKHIISCDYNDIIDWVKKVYLNYSYYHKKLFSDFDIDLIDKLNKKYYNKIFV